MRLARFGQRKRQYSVDFSHDCIEIYGVIPKRCSSGLGIELLETIASCQANYGRAGSDHSTEKISMLGHYEPHLYSTVEVLEVVAQIGIAEWRIVRNSEAVAEWLSFSFLLSRAAPEQLREVRASDQEALKRDERCVYVVREQCLVEVLSGGYCSFALKRHLVLKNAEDECIHARGEVRTRLRRRLCNRRPRPQDTHSNTERGAS